MEESDDGGIGERKSTRLEDREAGVRRSNRLKVRRNGTDGGNVRKGGDKQGGDKQERWR